MEGGKKAKRGRPAKPMPDQIPDTPENMVRMLMNTAPKRQRGLDLYEVQPQEKEEADLVIPEGFYVVIVRAFLIILVLVVCGFIVFQAVQQLT